MPLPRKIQQRNELLSVTVCHENCWAKTTEDDAPGISVRGHCLNVGYVAESLIVRLLPSLRAILPQSGIATLAALHDVGKITPGFQAKCLKWMSMYGLSERSLAWSKGSDTDHAKVSQYALQKRMSSGAPCLWAAIVGAHHGKIKGDRIGGITETDAAVWQKERSRLIDELVREFGELPNKQAVDAVLWLTAGLITVSDWIGSDEERFPQLADESIDAIKNRASAVVSLIDLGAGTLRPELSFTAIFPGLRNGANALQKTAMEQIRKPGLYVIEGPMGCGKTEAALAAAYNLVSGGMASGIYFALPTQTTSNRIHLRIAEFLRHAIDQARSLRLAHSSSWLNDDQTLSLVPASRAATPEEQESAKAGRLWFSSAKRALLTPFGVGTVDQALLGIVAAKHFFVRQFGLAGKVVILDEIHSYDLYTGTLIDVLVKRLLELQCTVIILSATLTRERRRTLLGSATSAEYPLLAAKVDSGGVVETAVEAGPSKEVSVLFKDPNLLVDAVLERANEGCCVLWIRNTVVESQQTYRHLVAERPQDGPKIALLHSRFPFFRREQLEEEWMVCLGKDSVTRPDKGCILVATQVVEQSVDIDADLLVTDLAPTDMLLQRMGRLWRHAREIRPCKQPEVWIEQPGMSLDEFRRSTSKDITIALGKSARVYAPYVLLRSLEQWQKVGQVTLPGDIRHILEATYEPLQNEPTGWKELAAELEEERQKMSALAVNATQIWINPALKDDEEIQTRYGQKSRRTVPLLLVTKLVDTTGGINITFLDGRMVFVPEFGFNFPAAKALHRNLVQIPRWCVLDCPDSVPGLLKPYLADNSVVGVVGDLCPERPGRPVYIGSDRNTQSVLYYRDDLGIVIDSNSHTKRPLPQEDWVDESCD